MEPVAIDLHHLELVPMEMHRVRHHRFVLDQELDALTLCAAPGNITNSTWQSTSEAA
jgi:hypothetical protein